MNEQPSGQYPVWDVFISHASEDKAAVAMPLANELRRRGLRVWYDEFSLTLGDSLRRSIDLGLARSRFGIVVLSRNFFAKEWPRRELDGLTTRELSGGKVILPIWHGVSQEEVARYSPTIADRLAVHTGRGIPALADAVVNAVQGGRSIGAPSPLASTEAKQFLENGEAADLARQYVEAAAWYLKAAELDDPQSQNRLGLMYRDGRGVPQDEDDALSWFLRAARQNFSTAMWNLAELYAHRKNNPFEAAVWYRKAASMGHADCMYRLAALYEEGKGVTRDYQEAEKWYQAFIATGRDVNGTAERAIVRMKLSPLDRFLRRVRNPRADL